MFNTGYDVAKEERSFADFGPLGLLEKKNGLEVGQQYVNLKVCCEFVCAITKNIESVLLMSME